ncbi:PH domain-containing protein [Halosegnis sp.]|uniref:PH domain-containing protein n=1 Tax=Halosegnis sp. TaxID=2864959 RepID=UPI0035D42ED1
MSGDALEPAVRQVDDAEPSTEELTGPERRLNPRVQLVWAVGSVVGALALGVGAAVVGFFVFNDPVPTGTAGISLGLAAGLILAVVRYRVWRYEVRADSLFLERGALTHVRTVVPYVRVQHVDVSRGPLERTLGLASVVVYTAGSRGADVTVPGLVPERAEELQSRLKQLAIAAEGDDAV